MGKSKEIIAVAGDVGGACALLPVLCELRRRNMGFSLVDHGIISDKAGKEWPRISESVSAERIISGDAGLLIFTTSVKDAFFDLMSKYYQGGKNEGVEWHSGRYVYTVERAHQEMEFLSLQYPALRHILSNNRSSSENACALVRGIK